MGHPIPFYGGGPVLNILSFYGGGPILGMPLFIPPVKFTGGEPVRKTLSFHGGGTSPQDATISWWSTEGPVLKMPSCYGVLSGRLDFGTVLTETWTLIWEMCWFGNQVNTLGESSSDRREKQVRAAGNR